MKDYKEFSVNDLWVELADYDPQYQETDAIHGDIEYLYMLEVKEPNHLIFKCWDVPCFGEYDFEKNENCEVIYEEHIYMNGARMKKIDKCTEGEDEEDEESEDYEEVTGTLPDINDNVEVIDVEGASEVIDDAKNSLESIGKRNMLVSQVVKANYSPYMTEEIFTQILKDFYDIIILKTKLNIV